VVHVELLGAPDLPVVKTTSLAARTGPLPDGLAGGLPLVAAVELLTFRGRAAFPVRVGVPGAALHPRLAIDEVWHAPVSDGCLPDPFPGLGSVRAALDGARLALLKGAGARCGTARACRDPAIEQVQPDRGGVAAEIRTDVAAVPAERDVLLL